MDAGIVRRRRRRQGGFTLIELLLVVVIIGILAAIVVPKLAGRSEDARIGAAQAQISSFAGALGNYEVDNGKYPTTDQGLMALCVKPTGAPEPKKWRRYLDSVELPRDPWGNEYRYVCPGRRDPEGYDLYSFGPDGQEGNDDDIWKP
jgi:general secretion pathway protein G